MTEQTKRQQDALQAMDFRQREAKAKERKLGDSVHYPEDYFWIKEVQELVEENGRLVAILANPETFSTQAISLDGIDIRGDIKISVEKRKVFVSPHNCPRVCYGEDPREKIRSTYLGDKPQLKELFFQIGGGNEEVTSYQVYRRSK